MSSSYSPQTSSMISRRVLAMPRLRARNSRRAYSRGASATTLPPLRTSCVLVSTEISPSSMTGLRVSPPRRSSARMRALLRRGGETRSPVIELGDISVDTNTHEVRKGGKVVALAPREYALLEFLALNRGIAKTRLEIIELVWGEYDELMFSQTVDVHVAYLRRKLGRESIVTVPGKGYMIGD